MQKKSIPFFDLTRQWKKIKSVTMPRIEALLDTQHCVGGPEVHGFEERFAHYTGSKHALSCSSGTSALWLALKALGLEANDIVVTTPFSFIASSSEIYAHGAHPVFIDIDSETYNLSPDTLAQWLSENVEMIDGVAFEKNTHFRVRGMVVVNIFGQCADYKRIRALCDAYNLWIVEDAAQSVGARCGTQKSGTLGDITTFSFYPTKNLGAAGDAGMITTQSDELADTITRLRAHNRTPHQYYNYQGYGVNSRCDALQSVILDEKLKHLQSYITRRRTIAHSYTTAFADSTLLTVPKEHFFHTYHQYSLRVNTDHISRDQLCSTLLEKGVATRIFYPAPLNTIPYLQTDPRLYTQCPVADRVCSDIICLPIWPELNSEEVEYIISTVIDVTHTVTNNAQPLSSGNHV